MWQNSTLTGLDEALNDLLQAIQHLPDGPKKKQLINQFNRLQKVRADLTGTDKPQKSSLQLLLLIGLGLLFILAAIGINLIFFPRKSRCP